MMLRSPSAIITLVLQLSRALLMRAFSPAMRCSRSRAANCSVMSCHSTTAPRRSPAWLSTGLATTVSVRPPSLIFAS
ncbi:CxxxxCH/CxxCH domain-containing protein [Pseudomonas sp. 30_B]|uniref:CxxxxCH/CxxCH domain-containing protein n=1 Tax=Pseudomonas sp. 30_B TaxID=2813575 RepID=UPI0034D2AC07